MTRGYPGGLLQDAALEQDIAHRWQLAEYVFDQARDAHRAGVEGGRSTLDPLRTETCFFSKTRFYVLIWTDYLYCKIVVFIKCDLYTC